MSANIQKIIGFLFKKFGGVNSFTYICHMKIEIEQKYLDRAIRYLTIYQLIHSDVSHEAFKEMMDYFEKLTKENNEKSKKEGAEPDTEH